MNKSINRHSSFSRSEAVFRGIAAAVFAGAICTASARADAINASAFAGHFDIMFPGYAGAAPLTDFPVLVRLSPALNGFNYSVCAAGGVDLRFADAAGNLLPCEVDTWNPGGESLVWVKVPSLSRATKITAYYGCANPPANTPSAVWSNGFVGVWHLGGTTLPLADSSSVSSGFSGSHNLSAAAFASTGRIGGAVDFTATNEFGKCWLSAEDADQLDGFDRFTIEVWTKRSSLSGNKYVLSKRDRTQKKDSYGIFQNGSGMSVMRFTTDGNTITNLFGSNRMTLDWDSWSYQAFVRDISGRNSYGYGYLNGSKTVENKLDTTDPVFAGTGTLYLGNYDDNSSNQFNGQIDELRISNVARSEDWVKATHDCVADADFAAYDVGNDWTRYANKFTVTFAGAPAGETLSNFPVLVKVSENNPEGFSYADCRKPNGGDLRFADANGNLLPSEVDTWNESGVSLIWVKVPSLTSSTKISAYYGWKDAPPVDPTAVWDSNYVGIWHLGESALPLKESSGRSYGFDTSFKNEETLGAPGVAGGCVDFSTGANAISNRLVAADSDALDNFTDFTIELWTKQECATNYTPYFLNKSDGQYAYLLHQQKESSSAYSVLRVSKDGTSDAGISGNAMIPTMGVWNHQAFVRDITSPTHKVYCYMNGLSKPEDGISFDGSRVGFDVQIPNSSSPLYLGNNKGSKPQSAFPGQIDELRISNVARSAAWVQATHDTVTSASFAQYSATRGNNDATTIVFR